MEMAAISGSGEEAGRFARALGLDPKKTKRIDLHIHADEIVTVTVTFMPSKSDLENLGLEIKRFKLVEDV